MGLSKHEKSGGFQGKNLWDFLSMRIRVDFWGKFVGLFKHENMGGFLVENVWDFLSIGT